MYDGDYASWEGRAGYFYIQRTSSWVLMFVDDTSYSSTDLYYHVNNSDWPPCWGWQCKNDQDLPPILVVYQSTEAESSDLVSN